MTFWVAAGLLALFATAFVAAPLLRRREETAAAVSAVIVIFAVPLGAVATYLAVSSQPADIAEVNELPPVEQMIAGLAERLERNPDDLEGWLTLGRSRIATGRYDLATDAYARAMALTDGKDPQAMLGYAEAQILSDRDSVLGEAGDLIEEVLESYPGNPRALWYGGLVAAARQQAESAITRWEALLATDPEPQVAAFLEQQLAALRAGAGQGPAGTSDPGSGGAGTEFAIAVSVTEEISKDFPSGAMLFLIARDAGTAGGPPIAVARYPADAIPGTFALSDANVMIPGRALAQPARLSITARISMAGTAAAAVGDLFGEVSVTPGETSRFDIRIDRAVE